LTDTDQTRRLVLDTSAFFLALDLKGSLYTVPSVEKELKDLRGKARFAMLLDQGLIIQEPEKDSSRKVSEASQMSGDSSALSETDRDLLALAVQLDATLLSDDFAIQNTAIILKIPVCPIIQREAAPRRKYLRCTGCGKFFDQMPDKTGDCPICGSLLKQKYK
jgi:UPF0271 protein